ncbi:MAG TPA: hydrolase [Gemmatimonadaceae bacterium]|nr:hydrolase [Gemmatimonadaceae bacterium]
MTLPSYRAAWWLPGPHLQTLWGRIGRRAPAIATRIERWDTPDGDFIDVHRLDGAPDVPRLVLLHGLEGSPRSHYAAGLFAQARRHGWAMDALVFRSCGDEPNRLVRSYHSGETGDFDFVMRRLAAAEPAQPLLLAGVSLGGNVLLKWLGERGENVPDTVIAAAAVSVPYDLAKSALHIDRGFARIYQAHFLRSLRRKAEEKRRRFPDAIRAEAIARARSIWTFDDGVTAPIHGFRDAADYYAQSSSLGFLSKIRVRTLLLSAVDDPFLPPEVLQRVANIAASNSVLTTEFTTQGGHVGFVGGMPWGPRYYLEERVMAFLEEQLHRARRERSTRFRAAAR